MESKDLERMRGLAESLDCVLSNDLRQFAGITANTEEAWAKRHSGPPFAYLGNQKVYPRQGLREFIKSKTRERLSIEAKGQL